MYVCVSLKENLKHVHVVEETLNLFVSLNSNTLWTP